MPPQQFFRCLVDEEEISVSPSEAPAAEVPEQFTPVLDDAAIRALLKDYAGREFADFRDTAIVRLFLDTGLRLGELSKVRVDDVDLDYDNTATVLGKAADPASARSALDGAGPRPLPTSAGPPEAS